MVGWMLITIVIYKLLEFCWYFIISHHISENLKVGV
uniref:Uncharacterized protein n=1 Tax=Rhizophora mucronata TaxID=61149 RepID=A0A2P2PC06_RHIMU